MAKESQYVSQYWPSLAQLTGRQIDQGQLGQSALYQQPSAPREFGKRQFGPDAPMPRSALEAQAQPAAVPATSPGARANPPQAPAENEAASFWKLTEEMSEDDKKKILKDFETAGVDVEGKFGELVDTGEIDPGLIKKGKDGKLDREDMGLFLMEFGLRTMAAGGQTQDVGAAIGGAALGTMEARRQRSYLAEDRKDKAEDREYKKSEDAQARKERGLSAVSEEQKRRDIILQKDAELKMRQREIEEARKDRYAARDLASQERGLDRESRESIAAENRAAREDDKKSITDAKVAELVAKRLTELDEQKYTARIGDKTWNTMSDAEKDAYLKSYARQMRSQFGTSGGEGDVGEAPSWAR